MLVEITVSGMIFQENRDNKNERFTVRGVFGLGPGSIRLHAEEQIETYTYVLLCEVLYFRREV